MALSITPSRPKPGQILTPSRRIERVAPIGERIVAMTFDCGPTRLAPDGGFTQGLGLTEHILAELRRFGARGTFNIIGSTAQNYPDTSGKLGTRYAFGNRYDHFAAFGVDDMAGAEACPELIRQIAREGHELSNHTYRHIMYGVSRKMRGTRVALGGLAEAVDDLQRLHALVYKLTKFEMGFMRPPHYIDDLTDGSTAYDACERLGYHYLGSSLAIDNDEDDAMLYPLQRALENDPASLAGQIISQRDGYNSWRRMPLAEVLGQQLELLQRYGYRVVSVGELMFASPFEDVRPIDDCFEAVRDLERAGFTLGFRDNRFYPERAVTKPELAAIFSVPERTEDGERPKNRPAAVQSDRREPVAMRLIVAAANEAFEEVEGQPRSATRGDVAIWLREVAAANGFIGN